MSARAWTAGALGVAGLALALGLFVSQPSATGPTADRVEVEDATATLLDTIAVRGRVVHPSVQGIVVEIGADDTVWLSTGEDAFPLRFASAPAIAVEDRVLATGRLRARGGGRWVEVVSWTRVEAIVPPADVRVKPFTDPSEPFGTPPPP